MKTLLALLLAVGADPRGPARLTLAVGAVEAKAPGQPDFAPLAVNADVEAGTTLRTGAGVLASLDLEGGLELRLAPNTELLLEGPRAVELKKGQFWMKVPEGPPCSLKTDNSTAVAEPGILDLAYTPRVPNTDQGAFTILHVFQGLTVLANRRFKQKVTAGYNCTVVTSVLNTPDPMGDPFLPTAWMHPLLLARGEAAKPEIERRARGLLSRLARVDKDDPFEASMKSLGEATFGLLGGYLAGPSNPADVARRVAAARVMADVATIKSAPLLLPLLDNETPGVRAAAAKGFARLAGTDQGRGDAYWTGDDRAAGIKFWDAWLKDPASLKR